MTPSTFYDIYRTYAAELWLLTAAVVVILGIWVRVLHLRLRWLRREYLRLMNAHEEENLESLPLEVQAHLRRQTERLQQLELEVTQLRDLVEQKVGQVGIVRFNPFNDMGGDQSFAIAWVNREGDGVVISSLHSRDGTRLYGKPLAGGQSQYTLSDEERRAIEQALGRLSVERSNGAR